jgi:hypothetical protein
VVAAALFHDRYCSPDGPFSFEIAKHDYRIAQITDVDRRLHRANQPVLRKHEDGQNANLAHVGQQLMHLQDQKSLIRHGI